MCVVQVMSVDMQFRLDWVGIEYFGVYQVMLQYGFLIVGVWFKCFFVDHFVVVIDQGMGEDCVEVEFCQVGLCIEIMEGVEKCWLLMEVVVCCFICFG